MKKILVQSHKGGVGKTTVALLLSKYAVCSKGKSVCVVDLDFQGAGIADLIPFRTIPGYIESFFLSPEPDKFKLDNILSIYNDEDIGKKELPIILNQLKGIPDKNDAIEVKEDQRHIIDMMADERHYGRIKSKTQYLMDKLEKRETDIVIFDCHPGLGFVSDAVRPLVDINLYITTPNRSDFFGILKEINSKGLDNESAALVLNKDKDRETNLSLEDILPELIKGEGVIEKPEIDILLEHLEYIGKKKENFIAIPEKTSMRNFSYIGTSGFLPEVESTKEFIDYCSAIFSFCESRDD